MVNWSPFVSGPLDVVDLDCSHPNLIAPEMVREVAAVIQSRISGQHPQVIAAKTGSIPPLKNSEKRFGSFLKMFGKSGGRKP